MKWLALTVLMNVGVLTFAADKPEAKQHVYLAKELHDQFRRPLDAKADWRPSTWIKANDTLSFIYPFAKKDMDAFFCSSDNGDVRLYVGEDEKGLRVGVDTGCSLACLFTLILLSPIFLVGEAEDGWARLVGRGGRQ